MLTSEKLKKIRKKAGYDQLKFAEIMGVSRQYISDLERAVKPLSHKFEMKLIEKGLISTEQEPEASDADIKQVMDLYTKFRDNKNIEAGELLAEKINLMLKILKSQK